MTSGGDVIDADVAEALKQLKRGFRETEQANTGLAVAPAKPRPPPPPWEPVKLPRMGPSPLPKLPAPQLPKLPAAQLPKPAPLVGPSLNLMSRPPGGVTGLGVIGGLRGLGGQMPFGGNQFGSANISGGGGPSASGTGGAATATTTLPLPSKNQVQIEIPQSSVGLLIGKQASTINAIKVFSRAHCFVDQHSPAEEKARVTIVGQPAEVEKCKRAVEGLIDGSMSTGMLFQLAGLPMPAGATNSAGVRPAGPAPLITPSTSIAPAAFATAPSAGAAVPPAAAAMPAIPASGPVMPAKAPAMLASAIAMPTSTSGMPMDNYLNEYYARCWSQYGNMANRIEEVAEEAGSSQSGPQAFDKAALARLAEMAAQNQENEEREHEQSAATLPEPSDSFPGTMYMQSAGQAGQLPMDATMPQAHDALATAQHAPLPMHGDLAERASTEVRQLLGDLPGSAPPESAPGLAPAAPKASPSPGLGVQPPLPKEAPVAKASPSNVFSGFTLQSTLQAPQAQKDSAAVQKVLQRLQGNMQQTKQAIAVQQVHAPQTGPQAAKSAESAAHPTSLVARPDQRGLANNEWEALEQRVQNARSPEEIADVGRAVLKKFPSLAPEQIAELLHKMSSMIGQYHGDFLTELSRLLSTRLKELSSTQFALLMSTFLLWPGETRERFSEFCKDFFEAACTEMPSRLMELAPHELNCCLAAFMSLGSVEHRFFTGVGRSALARHKTFGPVQLSSLLAILSEMRFVHVDLFNASAQVIATRVRELRPADMLRALRAFAKCSLPSEVLCQAMGDEVMNRYRDKGAQAGFRCEDFCEISWMFCVLQAYHENVFRLMFRQLEETPKVSTDSLCQVYECHLVLDSEHKKEYAKYRLEPDAVHALLEHYRENRRDARRCSDRQRSDVTAVLKSLVEGIVHANHRTSTGLLVDVAALRKRSSTDGYIHIDIDSSLTVVRSLDQEDASNATLVLDGSVALRRRILQKHDLRLVTVRENDWRGLEDTKEKRRHLRSLLASLGDVPD
mmetsp:Transcript_86215/g.279082  ORF Transcript_86215/g.279082 Transcript_86215/m.279082 type:complete len:1016 (+) Transcript_86215:69-3116(+)